MAHPASSRSPAPGTRFERGKLAEHEPVPEATEAADDTLFSRPPPRMSPSTNAA
jgi:hypothetical protein